VIHFIGATASSKLKVAIVGTITKIKVEMYLIAPKPTATPPKQPTIRMIKLINPNRLNSDSVTIFASICFVLITYVFLYYKVGTLLKVTE
jgi:hypothetical protein